MFGRKLNVYILQIVIVGLTNVATLYFTAHYMGPVPLGIIGFATSFIGMFFSFTELGLGQAHIKRVSEGKDIGKCIGTFFTLKISLIILSTLVIVGVLLFKKIITGHQFKDPEQGKIIYLLLIPVILMQFGDLAIKTFEAKKEAVKASLPNILSAIIKAPVTIGVAVLGFGVFGLVAARYVGAIVLVIVAFTLFKTSFKKPNKEYVKSYLTYASKIFFVAVLMKIAIELDRVMIGTFVSARAVGLFFSVQGIINFLEVIPNAVGMLLFPIISEQHSKGNFQKMMEYSYLTEKYIGILLIPSCILICFFSSTIIRVLLGTEFESANIPMILLALYFLINAMRKPVSSLLGGSDRAGLLARLAVISLLANISLNFILIPEQLFGIKLAGMGMNGAALATLISGIIFSSLCRIFVHRKLGTRPNNRMFLIYLAGIIMLISLYLVNLTNLISSDTLWNSIIQLVTYGLLGIIVFILVLLVTKEFTKRDLQNISEAINLRMMKNYINSEMKK